MRRFSEVKLPPLWEPLSMILTKLLQMGLTILPNPVQPKYEVKDKSKWYGYIRHHTHSTEDNYNLKHNIREILDDGVINYTPIDAPVEASSEKMGIFVNPL
ncbi:hypothetical protein AMTR_s00118p00140930 [Amborella trichopoda]|uniref:Uncharacterized protein n=1 Tax=Amborella trichopoda TaxID=13333 RepID=W1NNZ6_AMBTC|nr:hypothetical protein AMTR_s00118p00140930 [Amborella trichopoda]